MSIKKPHIILLYLLIFFSNIVFAQIEQKHISYEYAKGKVIIQFDNIENTEKLDSLMMVIGSSVAITDSLQQLGKPAFTRLGWELVSYSKDKIRYQKNLNNLNWDKDDNDYLFTINDTEKKLPYSLKATYGTNELKKSSYQIDDQEEIVFKLYGFPSAKVVQLAGSFNDWSTMECPLIFENGVWVGRIQLPPGKHLYRYIVDGYWRNDPNNLSVETDAEGNKNNVYYVYNHNFVLNGYSNARKVYVAGSFNNWNKKELQLKKINGHWKLPIYLNDGSYAYKFIVDGKWTLDPDNKDVVPNEFGNNNSFISLGRPYVFVLKGFENAEKVVCSGEFNDWNKEELLMTRVSNGWKIPYVLSSGNYAYKYLVDGKWTVDPNNPHQTGTGKFTNSVVAIDANHTFYLKGFRDERQVSVTGTFNNWNKDGYQMKKTSDGWQIHLHLPKGKVLYKFIIDDDWIADPKNPLWEENPYKSKNSILWIP